MKRFLPLIIAALVVAAIVITIILIRSDDERQAVTPTNTAIVEITANGFIPATLQVSPGTEVTWINADEKPRQLGPAEDTDSPLSSDILGPRETYSYIFSDSGSFNYTDPTTSTHNGVVEVVE